MLVLGIETSCDECAAALVRDGREVVAETVASQVQVHAPYGGVVPEVASREHLRLLAPVVLRTLAQAEVSLSQVDLVAVTAGPGLLGSLMVGVSWAKALAYSTGKPLVGVNHLLGHVYAAFLGGSPVYPLLALIVSGGHTDLVRVDSPTDVEVLGRTRDDAAGEALDKVARLLGLGYPGGPAVEALARRGDPSRVTLPRVHLPDAPWDFSFSGLKTAVRHRLEEDPSPRPEDVAAAFQEVVTLELADRTFAAARATGLRRLVLCGGVAANARLRREFEVRAAAEGMELLLPAPRHSTDNAAMIAAAGYYLFQAGVRHGMDLEAQAVMHPFKP